MQRAFIGGVFALGVMGGPLIAAYYFPDNVGAILLGAVAGMAAAVAALQAVLFHRAALYFAPWCAAWGWVGYKFSRFIGRGTALSVLGALFVALLGCLVLSAFTNWREDRLEEIEYNSDDLDGTYIWPRPTDTAPESRPALTP